MNCRSANRNRNNPDNRNNNIGFRVALAPASSTPDSRIRWITVYRSVKTGVQFRYGPPDSGPDARTCRAI